MQELCWACETMTRQMQWEVFILPAPPLPNKESRLSPAMFSLCSASHAQLWRPVWEWCLHPACILVRKAGRSARCHSRPQQVAKSSGHPSSLQLEGGEIGKRKAEVYFKVPKRRASLRRVKARNKTAASKLQQHSHLGTPVDTWQVRWCYADASHHITVIQSTLTTEYSFSGVEGNWFINQRWYGRTWEKQWNNLTLSALCRMQQHQEDPFWANLHKDKATPC